MAVVQAIENRISISHPLQRMLFMFVWLMFFMNAIVLKEPAPCDLFMMAFVIIMPVFGLVRFTYAHGLLFIAWMIIVGTGFIAGGLHEHSQISYQHMAITFYLAMFSVVLAGFVAKNPGRHFEIIWNGYMFGAIVAAVAGIIGYFDLIPGSFELFTKYSRASGTFKDPNVFGPFLVPAFLYCLHNLLTRGAARSLVALPLMALFLFGILMCFSRGAWLMFGVASALYVFIFFLTADNNRQRVKTVMLCALSLVALLCVVGAALQSPKVHDLWEKRASISQDYDVGEQGRFTGHEKAAKLIVENPLGIGALYFGYFYHHELPHNLYLTMYLNSGWLGGTLFLIMMLSTIVFGFTILNKRTSWMRYYIIAFSTFIGLALESYIIDSDHWRLLYILIGLIWGSYAALNSNETTRQSLDVLA